MSRQNTNDVLILCTIIGGAIGLAVAKRSHAAFAFIVGPILGLFVGLWLDWYVTHRR